MKDPNDFEVIIIGGSYSGLSAALALGRSLRRVLVIDSGLPCNRQTPHSQNFLTQDGKTPAEISMIARSQVEKYETVKFHNGLAEKAIKKGQGFEIETDREEKFTAKRIIFATGIKDQMPEIKGFKECWGISIIHCPYCHGYEHKGQRTAIMASGEKAFHLASLVSNLTSHLTILTRGEADFTPEQRDKLGRRDIKIIVEEISEVLHKEGKLQKVVFQNGSTMVLDALYAALPFTQHSSLPASLGCELTEDGYLKVDDLQRTTVEGLYACGDNFSRMRSLAGAVYSGNLTGALVNGELSSSEF